MRYSCGQDIDTMCTRCKMELAHTILAEVNGVPARVKCNTCHSERNFRAPKRKAASAPKKGTRKLQGTASRRGATKVAGASTIFQRSEKWAEMMAKADAGVVPKLEYDMRERFAIGAVIVHRKFGGGVVEAQVENKIRVCFADGERLLIHGRG